MKARPLAALVVIAAIGLATLKFWSPVWAQVPTVTRTWTAVGDDSLANGPVAAYLLRWKDNVPFPAVTDTAGRRAWWNTATPVTGMPSPVQPTFPMNVQVARGGGLQWSGGHVYTWVLVAVDDAGNFSDYSNVVNDTITLMDLIRPASVKDLH